MELHALNLCAEEEMSLGMRLGHQHMSSIQCPSLGCLLLHSSPPPDIVSSSVDHLLPVFATVPGTDHDFTLITPHPSTFSPSLVDVGRVREVLESCLEQLPSPLPLRGACGVGEVFDRVLPLCVQLPSAEQYRSYALYTVHGAN